VVVDRDRQDLLRLLLTDDVVVQVLVDLTGLGKLVELHLGALRELLLDDLVAEIDALVADVDAGARDELLDLLLALAAETSTSAGRHRHRTWPRVPLLLHRTRRVSVRSAHTRRHADGCQVAIRDHLIDDPVLLGFRGAHDEVASVSCATFSTSWPVWWARISSRDSRMRTISLAWISMSTA